VDLALKYLNDMPETWKPLVRVYMFPIRALIRARRYQEARDLFTRLDNVDAFYSKDLRVLKGECLKGLGDGAGALALFNEAESECDEIISGLYAKSSDSLIADSKTAGLHENEVFWNRLAVLFTKAGNFNGAGVIEDVFVEMDWELTGTSLLEIARALVGHGRANEAQGVVGLIREREGSVGEEVMAGVRELSL
jgi:hypothetical protein